MTQYPDIQFRKYIGSAGKIDWFQVATPCSFQTALADNAVIPAGYITDFASVPRWLWSILPPHGRMANAAMVHDYCYDYQLGQDQYGAERARLIADIEFAWRCRDNGVSKTQVIIVLGVIRLFGRKWWSN